MHFAAKRIMSNSKPMLLSLSLAGAIGFYLYNKLIQTGNVATLSPNMETCEEKTRRELQPRLPVAEQPKPDLFEDAVETVVPVVETETPVQDEFDALLAEAAEAEVEAPAPVVEEVADVTPVVNGDNDNAMSFDDLMNMGDEEPTSLLDDEDEVVEPEPEPVVEEPVVEAPVLPSFVSLNKHEEAPVETPAPVEEPAPVVEPVNLVKPIAKDEVVDLLAEEEVPAPVVEPIVPEHRDRGFKPLEDMPIEELLEKDKQALMENSEALHTVDAKDPAAKREFDSIMDFFNEL